MSLSSNLQKTGAALLKAVPLLGHAAASVDAITTIIDGTQDPRWKTIQAGVTFVGSSSCMTGIFLSGFHHPAAAAVAFTAGVGTHLLAGAAEFAPAKIQAPFTRAVGHAIDSLLGGHEIASR